MKASVLFCLAFPAVLYASGALADDTAMRACRTVTESDARLNCYDKIALGSNSVHPGASNPAPALTPQQSFGLRPAAMAVQARPEQIDAIDSTIVGTFDGWGPGTTFSLANGQRWKIIDGSEAVLAKNDHQQVKITRNFLGTLFMQFEGSNQSPKVRRVE
jgi:hypothetical protein